MQGNSIVVLDEINRHYIDIPANLQWKDIQVKVDDDYLSGDLMSVYGYETKGVPFRSMKDVLNCPYLSGKTKAYA